MKKIIFLLSLLFTSLSCFCQNTGSLPYKDVMLKKTSTTSTDSCPVFDNSTRKWKLIKCSALNTGVTSTLLDTLGSLFSISGTTWNTNSASFTKTGAAATFTHGSSKVSIASGAGNLSNYYTYDTYGTTNLDYLNIRGTFVITNVASASSTIGFGLQSSGSYTQGGIQFLVDLKAASSGRLTICVDNDTTPVITSQNRLAIIVGDTVSFDIKILPGKALFSIKPTSGTNKNKVNLVTYDRNQGKGFHTAKVAMYAVGGQQGLTAFSANSSQKKNATALFLGNSIAQGGFSRNMNSDYVNLLKNICHGTFETLSGSGNTLLDLSGNITEITRLAPRNIFIAAGINDIAETSSLTTVMSRLRTLVSSLTSAGYVSGTNLFIIGATPTGNSINPTYNDSVRVAYPTGYVDIYDLLKDPASSLNLNPIYVTPGDLVHPNPDGHREWCNGLIAQVPSVFLVKNNTEANGETAPYILPTGVNNKRTLNAYTNFIIGSSTAVNTIYSTNATTTPASPIALMGPYGAEISSSTGGCLSISGNGNSIFSNVYNGSKLITRAGIGFGFSTSVAGSEDGYVTIQTKTAGGATAENFRFGQTGMFGVGLAATKGWVEIQAGTTSVPPFVLTEGLNTTTAVKGAIEFTSGNLLFSGVAAARRRVAITNNGTPSNGQIPIGNGTDYTIANITAGSNIAVTNASGSITIAYGGYVAKTSNYTATTTDYLINCTANSFTVTLPTAVSAAGKIYEIVNSGAGTITIGTTSSQTFTNVTATPTTLSLGASAAKSVRVMSDGANWIQLN